MLRKTFVRMVAVALLAIAGQANGRDHENGRDTKWVATWITAPQNTFKGVGSTQTAALANFAFPFTAPALPQANNQTLRMIVKPDIWGSVMRVRLSNKWGTGPVTFGSVSIGLQSFSGAPVAGSNTPVLFGGSRSVTVKKGTRSSATRCGSAGRGERGTATRTIASIRRSKGATSPSPCTSPGRAAR